MALTDTDTETKVIKYVNVDLHSAVKHLLSSVSWLLSDRL